MDETDAVELPIDGVLDLHTFSPKDAAAVVEDYLEACAEKGIQEVRIIHGKGRGVLRRIVHAVLDRHPGVEGYRLDDGSGGGWGATLVRLAPGRPSSSGH
jgi:DNA-nicking Smr family endonuclease